MQDETSPGMINWIGKLARKLASGRIVPIHYGDNVPPSMADYVKDAQAIWVILLADSRFEIDGLFTDTPATSIVLPSHNKKRIMFPCPMHNHLDNEAQANVIRHSKLAQDQGAEVKWVDHEIHESMIIINPPTENNPNPDNGIALIDLSLPHLDTTARAKFEITQKHQSKIFSDLVKSFSLTWGHAHGPHYDEAKAPGPDIRTKRVLKEKFVGVA